MSFDKHIIQYYTHAVDVDHIRTYIWDRDLEDTVAVCKEDMNCFTFYYNSDQLSADHLHYHLDNICDYLISKKESVA